MKKIVLFNFILMLFTVSNLQAQKTSILVERSDHGIKENIFLKGQANASKLIKMSGNKVLHKKNLMRSEFLNVRQIILEFILDAKTNTVQRQCHDTYKIHYRTDNFSKVIIDCIKPSKDSFNKLYFKLNRILHGK